MGIGCETDSWPDVDELMTNICNGNYEYANKAVNKSVLWFTRTKLRLPGLASGITDRKEISFDFLYDVFIFY